MFNENPGTSILMRRGGSTVARTEAPFCLSLFLAGAALWNELAESVYVFLRGSAAHEEKKKNCRAELWRPRLPRRSDAEIFIRCLFSLSPWREKRGSLSVFKTVYALCLV